MGITSSKSEKKKGKNLKGKNLLDFVPVRICKWSHQEEKKELIRILKPRFDTKLGKRMGNRMNLKETYNINLDEYGTTVWRLIDGELSVREIGEILITQFGETVEPLYPRLAAFLRILEANNAVELRQKRIKKKLKRI
jgi:hypothetical protein